MYCTSFWGESKSRFTYPIPFQNLSLFCLIFQKNTLYTSSCLFRARIPISRFLQKFVHTNSKNSWYTSFRLSWLTITIYSSLWIYRLSISEILSRERFGFRKIHFLPLFPWFLATLSALTLQKGSKNYPTGRDLLGSLRWILLIEFS